MSISRVPKQRDFEILAGGREKLQALQQGLEFDPYAQFRRALFMQSAFNLMAHAGLKRKSLPDVAHVVHSPSLALGNITPWHSSGLSNLWFHFSTRVLRQEISNLSGKDVDLTRAEQKALKIQLIPLIDFGTTPRSLCERDIY